MEHDENSFELETGDLLQWVKNKTSWLKRRDFPNSLEGVRQSMQEFKNYRINEKPPRFNAKGNLEAALFTIQMKLRSSNRVLYQVCESFLNYSFCIIRWGDREVIYSSEIRHFALEVNTNNM